MRPTKTKPVLRLTPKRRAGFGRIQTSIAIRLSSFEEGGLMRQFALTDDKLDDTARAKRLKELDDAYAHYAFLHDVVAVYTARHLGCRPDVTMKEKRGWKNEHDIPLDVYNQAMDDIVALLTWQQENAVGSPTAESRNAYNEHVALLTLAKTHRNEQEE